MSAFLIVEWRKLQKNLKFSLQRDIPYVRPRIVGEVFSDTPHLTAIIYAEFDKDKGRVIRHQVRC